MTSRHFYSGDRMDLAYCLYFAFNYVMSLSLEIMDQEDKMNKKIKNLSRELNLSKNKFENYAKNYSLKTNMWIISSTMKE